MTYFYICLLFFHFVGDFVCQSRYLADNKSKSWLALFLHVAIYTCIISWLPIITCHCDQNVLGWIFINFALHFITDAITSRLTSKFWREQRIKAFFNTVGFDQFLHGATLLATSHFILH
jgi:hypothetical protein